MLITAEAKVRAKLMALRQAIEAQGADPALTTSAPRKGLGVMQHQDTAATEEARRAEAIKRIDMALERLDAHKYGYCIVCGAEIEDKRLEADPAVLNCAKCAGDQQQ